MNDWEENVHKLLEAVRSKVVRFVRWLPTLTILVVIAILVLHRFHPPMIEWLGELIGMAEPSLAAAVAALIISTLVLERVFHLEKIVRRAPIRVFRQREQAYKDLAAAIRKDGAKRVDLLQFSGFTVLDLLRAVAERSPGAQVRMLLMHPDEAAHFDADNKPSHRNRIATTVQHIEVMENERPADGFHVDIRYYTTPPSVSAILVDGRTACLSWYHAFPDNRIVRIRGHTAPTITAFGDEARALYSFAKDQFDKLWPPEPPATIGRTGASGAAGSDTQGTLNGS